MVEKIIEAISAQAKVDSSLITEETNILDLDIDSLGILKIIMDVESSFGVRFDDEEIVEIRTANDIKNLILKKFN